MKLSFCVTVVKILNDNLKESDLKLLFFYCFYVREKREKSLTLILFCIQENINSTSCKFIFGKEPSNNSINMFNIKYLIISVLTTVSLILVVPIVKMHLYMSSLPRLLHFMVMTLYYIFKNLNPEIPSLTLIHFSYTSQSQLVFYRLFFNSPCGY